MTRFVLLATAALLASAPAYSAVVFSTDFDAENGGNTAINFASFAGLTVTGNVDLVKSGDYGLTCAGGSGSCVDLDGSTGPGTLTSTASYAFAAGDMVRLSFDLSGSQVGGGSDQYQAGFTFGSTTTVLNYGFNFFGSDQVIFPAIDTGGISSSTAVNAGDPFATRSIFFTAGTAGTLTFSLSTNSADNIGPILDNVSLDVGSVPEPATWAMMIGGMGFVGGALRRRQRTTVAVTFA